MENKAYIKNGTITVQLSKYSMLWRSMNYDIGKGVTDFSMFPTRIIQVTCERFRSEFLASVENGETDEQLFETLKAYVEATAAIINVYFNFYMEMYVYFLICLKRQEPGTRAMLERFLFVDVSSHEVDFTDLEAASKWGAQILIYDLETRRDMLKSDFDFITSEAESNAELAPLQRLYLLSKQGRKYLSAEFKTVLVPDRVLPDEKEMDKLKSTLLASKVDIVEMVTINTLDDLMSYELFHTLKANLQIQKCKHCDEYFIVRGRTDTEYCDRVKEGESKPCSMVGATRSYWGSKADDPIYAEFQKAYKRNHSRQRMKKMTQNEFYEWSEAARKKRGECERGEMTIEEFRKWLGN